MSTALDLTRLRHLRQTHFFLQKDVARCLGISRAHYTRIENGQVKPNCDQLARMADLYNVALCYLFYTREVAPHHAEHG